MCVCICVRAFFQPWDTTTEPYLTRCAARCVWGEDFVSMCALLCVCVCVCAYVCVRFQLWGCFNQTLLDTLCSKVCVFDPC